MSVERVNALLIVPAYNEEASLPLVLEELRETAPQFDVVVVNDGSSDATAAIARELGVPVLDLCFNLGIGGAVQTGFKYALRKGIRRGRAGRQRRAVPAGQDRVAGGAGAGRGLGHGDRLALPGGAGLRGEPAASRGELHPVDDRGSCSAARR